MRAVLKDQIANLIASYRAKRICLHQNDFVILKKIAVRRILLKNL